PTKVLIARVEVRSGEHTRPRVLVAAPRRNGLSNGERCPQTALKFATVRAPSPAHGARALPRTLMQESRRDHALTLDLVRNQELKVLDEGIDLAQIFAPALLWLQFAFAHEDGEIAQLMQPLARQLFRGLARFERGAAL